MVNYLKTIDDREKRNEQARAIIKVMEILNPAVHLEEDFEHKLWDHLYIISGFDLDIDAPYPMPAPDSLNTSMLCIYFIIQRKIQRALFNNMNKIMRTYLKKVKKRILSNLYSMSNHA